MNCYWASGGNWPSEQIGAGLHFIRGYGTGNVGSGPPDLRTAYLENANCTVGTSPVTGYFHSDAANECDVRLHATIDLGSADPDGAGPLPVTDRSAANAEVRYRIVSDTGTQCAFGTSGCSLSGSSSGSNTGWVTSNTLPHLDNQSMRNSITMRIRLNNTTVSGTQCPPAGTFNSGCQWFFTSDGTIPASQRPSKQPYGCARKACTASLQGRQRDLGTHPVAPADDRRRLRRGRRRNRPGGCEPDLVRQSLLLHGHGPEGRHRPGRGRGAILFNDGVGSSQMGAVDCDPNIPQGQILIDGINQGCGPWYAKHPFDGWSPLCPAANSIYSGYPGGNPGPPWDDGRWPPLRCVKTRPTGSMNQLDRGFNLRVYGNQNQNSCPGGVRPPRLRAGAQLLGRTNNQRANPNPTCAMGTSDDTHARHQLLETGQRGSSRSSSSRPRRSPGAARTRTRSPASSRSTSPGTGDTTAAATRLRRSVRHGSAPRVPICKGSSCGNAIWGHVLNYAIPSPMATPSGVICNPGVNFEPCVAVLVE